jgi:hypothetical protein
MLPFLALRARSSRLLVVFPFFKGAIALTQFHDSDKSVDSVDTWPSDSRHLPAGTTGELLREAGDAERDEAGMMSRP